eukprot:TRINITY_DN8918_c0_g1_i1.p2 TRINITY_DN8918_c0_g1~~TRINITY_DN8918_c0_g1_i1.p2  ORF type:complete len:157 (-),score=32.52 TRINITY_DN8918_c0_g1_i1:352-822(-)
MKASPKPAKAGGGAMEAVAEPATLGELAEDPIDIVRHIAPVGRPKLVGDQLSEVGVPPAGQKLVGIKPAPAGLIPCIASSAERVRSGMGAPGHTFVLQFVVAFCGVITGGTWKPIIGDLFPMEVGVPLANGEADAQGEGQTFTGVGRLREEDVDTA